MDFASAALERRPAVLGAVRMIPTADILLSGFCEQPAAGDIPRDIAFATDEESGDWTKARESRRRDKVLAKQPFSSNAREIQRIC
jgi:hypothetical protein